MGKYLKVIQESLARTKPDGPPWGNAHKTNGVTLRFVDAQSNCITFWYPILKRIGMRVPRTEILYTECEFIRLFDQEKPDGLDEFIRALSDTIARFTQPCFLRSGQTSSKHDWKNSCFVNGTEGLLNHVMNIAEFSEIVGWGDLPYNVWAVRELIPTTPLFHGFCGDMPITREFRLFIRDGEVECIHPYWPEEAFAGHVPDEIWKPHIQALQELPDADREEITKMARYISRYIPGYWSVDFLQDTGGQWWVTDMALGENSYHWPGCEKARKEKS